MYSYEHAEDGSAVRNRDLEMSYVAVAVARSAVVVTIVVAAVVLRNLARSVGRSRLVLRPSRV